MKKTRLLLFFLLWSLFWVVVSMLWLEMFFKYMYSWYGDDNQVVRLNTDNILTSLKNSLKTVDMGISNDRYSKFDTIWNVLNKQYYDNNKLDFDKMLDNALKWYVDAIWDPYTVYFTTTENKWFQEDLKWEKDFEWVWAVVAKKEWWVMVEEVLKWLPAYKAWVKPLDLIIEINWEKTKDLTLVEAVWKIRGPKWTEVVLTIIRKWVDEIMKITVIRDKVIIPSVMAKIHELTWWNNIWYINISIIWEDTEQAFKSSIDSFKDKNVKWIILDLRWNWWWYLPVAVTLSSYFIPKWQIVVTSKYRLYPDEVYKSEWYWDLEWLPVIVLVDWLTASASEIITAALKDNIWATIIWTQTFGKWSIQTIADMKWWSSLKYTVGKWYTPKWVNVDQKWIDPDEVVELDEKLYKDSEIDSQLEKSKSKILEMIKK